MNRLGKEYLRLTKKSDALHDKLMKLPFNRDNFQEITVKRVQIEDLEKRIWTIMRLKGWR